MPALKFEGTLILKRLFPVDTYLNYRDDVCVFINIFDTVKLSKLSEPTFPLEIHEIFSFEKVFYDASSSYDLCRKLEDIPVTIELRQVTDCHRGGSLLAYFDGNARDLFDPCPVFCSTLGTNRELLMRSNKSSSPRLEFSTSTKIVPYVPSPPVNSHADGQCCCNQKPSSNYARPTFTSALKSTNTTSTLTGKNMSRHVNCFNTVPGHLDNRSPSKSPLGRPATSNLPCCRCPADCCCVRKVSPYDLTEKELKAAQERSDRYWHMYRFWQREVENIRRNRT
uniref:Spermatogenesis-associated protein 6 n=2 Tax=Schistocephalus solidus TaxID=70667 RepID=A0A0X3NR28_SCHSO